MVDRRIVSPVKQCAVSRPDALQEFGDSRIILKFAEVSCFEFGKTVLSMIEPSSELGRGRDLLTPQIERSFFFS